MLYCDSCCRKIRLVYTELSLRKYIKACEQRKEIETEEIRVIVQNDEEETPTPPPRKSSLTSCTMRPPPRTTSLNEILIFNLCKNINCI